MKNFRNFGILTIVSVYLLILVGGVVRTTGSGMGCPDWPKCFGQWVPPTEEAQLPSNYRDVYRDKRIAKNERVALLFDKIGFKELAFRITKDPSVMIEEPFNATKTWIEYINRVLGVLIGFFIFLTFIFSLPYWRKDRTIIWLSLAALIGVALEGFIGSIVVSTNLLPSMVTVHMLLALVVVALLIFAIARSHEHLNSKKLLGDIPTATLDYTPSFLNYLLIICLATSFVQVFLGTQVRETIDVIAAQFQFQQREKWIDELGLSFYIHRSFSLVIFAIHSYLVYVWLRQKTLTGFNNWAYALIGLLFAEILTGVIMAYFAMPAFLQPIHLTLAALIFGIQFYLWLLLNRESLLSVPKTHLILQ
ncbi:MAG: COX15/CtaA family protein [Thermoflexibacteraceae bacterium]|jgi:cytochrome c oxidase assembly protein subunit 15